MTGAADPGFIASLTTVHLLLLAATAAAVIFVMLIAIRRRRRDARSAEAAERRREEAEGLTEAGDDDEARSDGQDAPVRTPLPDVDPAPERVAPPTAPPPPPLADPVPMDDRAARTDAATDDPPPPRSGRMLADAPDSDDLTQMKGVGPKLAQRLAELGYTRFAQIAALTPGQAGDLDAQLGSFQGRMARDRWIEQAGFLARGDRAGYEAVFGRL